MTYSNCANCLYALCAPQTDAAGCTLLLLQGLKCWRLAHAAWRCAGHPDHEPMLLQPQGSRQHLLPLATDARAWRDDALDAKGVWEVCSLRTVLEDDRGRDRPTHAP